MIEALTLSAFDRAAASARPEAAAPLQRAALPPVTGAALPGVEAAAPADFGQIMASFATGVRDQVRAGEAASIAGIQGKASAQQVVEAVMSAEQSLQTAVAIRDKVVAAYLELSRMAI
ncbi:flagellar hook-basal body protein FliE [Methylobacterium variabile]|jgi:flagellar hook-basal body complex protein FliE|uniref:Flagellar hook-basal body complex protein FliE n=1 Tax=Methylobacterium variabile TaxID=298794 RepID=A0A0J6S887_9HYPH|nr:flagellar hook-basal body complex protein FliE [Methylobacterium variabile]KMO29862.1 flagellar hook-basal body protein FliE [Methylobacterium variabile]